MLLYASIVSCYFQCLLVQTFALNVEKFLTDYEYINPFGYSLNAIQDGILKFQEVFHLNRTGLLDPETIRLMETPRCGMADNVQAMRSKETLFWGGRKWGKSHLTYKIINTGDDLHNQTVYRIMQESFQMWSDVSALTFSRVQRRRWSDITILFGSRNHGDSSPFDGKGGTLAHAFLPTHGKIHFDMDETYTDKTKNGINLLQVAVHEIGHALGLRHSNIRESIMFPAYTGYQKQFFLHEIEVKSLQSVYGNKTTIKPTHTSFTTATTSSTPSSTTNPSTRLPTGGCKDRYTMCSTYKNKCNPVDFPGWKTWVMKNCRYTCGFCTTVKTSCRNIREKTFCDSNKQRCSTYSASWTDFMRKYCHKTCGCK